MADQRPKAGRGGKRPGAGGKPGNLNALKHGRYSLVAAKLRVLLESEQVRQFAERMHKRNREAAAKTIREKSG